MGISLVGPGARAWRRSSRCDSNACVEMAERDGMVAVRDNTRPGHHLTFDRASWEDLLRAIHAGQLHRP